MKFDTHSLLHFDGTTLAIELLSINDDRTGEALYDTSGPSARVIEFLRAKGLEVYDRRQPVTPPKPEVLPGMPTSYSPADSPKIPPVFGEMPVPYDPAAAAAEHPGQLFPSDPDKPVPKPDLSQDRAREYSADEDQGLDEPANPKPSPIFPEPVESHHVTHNDPTPPKVEDIKL